MKYSVYSHKRGAELVPKHIKSEIIKAITCVSIEPTKGAATKIRDAFLSSLKISGWPGKVSVSGSSKMTITSLKDEVGICLQTGNMGRMYADLLKLQTMYQDESIKSAGIIIPCQPMAKTLGDNIANAQRLESELEIFKRVYFVPTLIFAMEVA